MAECPKCRSDLGLRTSFALANFWSTLPLMAQPLLITFHVGHWAFSLWTLGSIVYLIGLAVFFSYYARPFVADPPIEGGW